MANSNSKQLKRKKTFIDRNVQGALVRRLALHWFSFLIVGTAVTLVFQYLTDPFKGLDKHFDYFLQHQAGFITVMLCMTPVFLFDTVKLSHRFAGPILRLRRALKELASGDEVERVTFRPGDFWGELADDFNAVLDRQQLLASADHVEDSVEDELELAANVR
jgi:methyl-accepting chemotaxis protein